MLKLERLVIKKIGKVQNKNTICALIKLEIYLLMNPYFEPR